MNIPQKTNPPALDRETVIPELVTHSTSLLDPKEYRDEYADQMLNYFMNHKKYHTIYDTHYFQDGHSEEKARQVPNPPPSFREFAASLFVTTHRLKSWGKKNPRFREALEECGEIVKEFIIENGITGKYSSQFAIFVAKNVTDMKDKTEVTKKTVTVHKLLNAIEAAPTPAALKAADTEGLYEAEI